MNKKTLFWLFIEWSIYFALVYWLVDGSFWLDLFLTSALSHAAFLSRRSMQQKQLFDIADAELVRVSTIVDRLENELSEIQTKLETAEAKIDELEVNKPRQAM